jgi:acetolactate synthase-1/2/3 large subunit
MAQATLAAPTVTGAEALVRMLALHGVKHIFGLCGDTSLPFYDALYRLKHGMTHILTRDERSAAYMADGYARVSGRVGVCEGPSGGGATYILPGVAEANESSVPLLCITSDISIASRGRFTLTELDQEALFRPVTKSTQVVVRGDRMRSPCAGNPETTTGRPGAASWSARRAIRTCHVLAARRAGCQVPALRIAPDQNRFVPPQDACQRASPRWSSAAGPFQAAEPERSLKPLGDGVHDQRQGSLAETHPLVASNGGTLHTGHIGADVVVFIGCRAGSVTTEMRPAARGDARPTHRRGRRVLGLPRRRQDSGGPQLTACLRGADRRDMAPTCAKSVSPSPG